MEESTRLEFSDERQQVTSLAEINGALAEVGSRLWPLDLHHAPADIQQLLRQPALTAVEAGRVEAHFLLSRERLLEIIVRAGRTPHVPTGGAFSDYSTSRAARRE